MKTANSQQADYPRGLPFRPPEQLQVQAARLRRWTGFLLFATALVLVGSVAAFVYFRNEANRAAPEILAPEIAAPESSFTPPAALPKPSHANPSAPAIKIEPASQPANPKKKELLLEALGSLSSIHLYQSYLNIGLIADAVESEAYTKTDAANLLQTILDLVNSVDTQLQKVAQAGLETDDHEALNRIRDLTTLLRGQSQALLGYWATGDMDFVDRYHQARERTWDDLKEMLGMED